jgi:hypothetical protein
LPKSRGKYHQTTKECSTCKVPLCWKKVDGSKSCFDVWHDTDDLAGEHKRLNSILNPVQDNNDDANDFDADDEGDELVDDNGGGKDGEEDDDHNSYSFLNNNSSPDMNVPTLPDSASVNLNDVLNIDLEEGGFSPLVDVGNDTQDDIAF